MQFELVILFHKLLCCIAGNVSHCVTTVVFVCLVQVLFVLYLFFSVILDACSTLIVVPDKFDALSVVSTL